MSEERLRQVAERFDRIADALRLAAEHAATAGRHFRDADVPRGCAHALALEGHLRSAMDEVARISKLHAERSNPMG
jgi:hypothetical protein